MSSPLEWFNAVRTFCILLASGSVLSSFMTPILPLNISVEYKTPELDIKREKYRMLRIWKEVYYKNKHIRSSICKKRLYEKYKKRFFKNKNIRYILRNRIIYRNNNDTEK